MVCVTVERKGTLSCRTPERHSLWLPVRIEGMYRDEGGNGRKEEKLSKYHKVTPVLDKID